MIGIKGTKTILWPRVNNTLLPFLNLPSPSEMGKGPRDSKLFGLEGLPLKFRVG